MLTITVTGHRPPRIGGYDATEWHRNIKRHMRGVMIDAMRIDDVTVISGMALGIDQWFAEVAQDLSIPVIAAMPFPNQGSNWPDASRRKLQNILDKCSRIEYLSPVYTKAAFIVRDKWMVDNANLLIAYWDEEPIGGTYQTITYARNKGYIVPCYNPIQFQPTA